MRKHHLFQGRSEEQLKGSYLGAFVGLVGMLFVVLLLILSNLIF